MSSEVSRCSAADIPGSQRSIGPPGRPSNTMMSHGPLRVRAGNEKYSPIPGMMLKPTAENSGRGSIPWT
jgi:hypothetical protein